MDIDEMIFLRCKFSCILSKNVNWYQQINELKFQEMKFDLSQPNAFGFPCDLLVIRLINVQIMGIAECVFQPFKDTLKIVEMEIVPPNTTVNSLFDTERVWNIIDLFLISQWAAPKIIAPSNFSSLPMLQRLGLINFGIEAILPNSFDFLDSLRVINLSNNRLKSIESVLFHKLLSSMNPMQARIDLRKNRLNCNCETFKLVGIYMANDDTDFKSLWVGLECAFGEVTNVRHDQCDLQLIHGDRVCFTFALKYLYPRFVLRINLDKGKHDLIIKTAEKDRYRVLIIDYYGHSTDSNAKLGLQRRFCPGKQTMDLIMRCFLFANGSATISFETFVRKSAAIGLCVNYVTRKSAKFWPLHCVTYADETDPEPDGIYGILIIAFFAAATGALLGMAVIIPIYSRLFPKDETEENTNWKVQTINRGSFYDFDCEDFYENPDYEYINVFDYLRSDCDKTDCASGSGYQHEIEKEIYVKRNSLYENEKKELDVDEQVRATD